MVVVEGGNVLHHVEMEGQLFGRKYPGEHVLHFYQPRRDSVAKWVVSSNGRL